MNQRTREWLVILALLLVVGLTLFLAIRPGHPWGGDFSLYIHHALNLIQGTPYGDTGYHFNPAYPGVGPPTYPPGLPLLLAPVIAFCGVNFTALKLVILVGWVTFVLMAYLCFRRDLPFPFVVALLAIVGLNHFAIPDVNSIGSDVPFMALLYAAIFVIRKAYDTPEPSPPHWGWLALAVGLAYASFATRTLGIVLVPSLLIHDAIRYRRITRWAVVTGGAFAALVLLHGRFLHSGTSYLDEYRGVGLDVYLHHAYLYATRLAAYWHNGYSKPLAATLFLVLAALAAAGYLAGCRRKLTLIEIFPVLYLAAVVGFPGYQAERYLIPIMPFFVLFAFRGLQLPRLVARPRLRKTVLAGLAVFIAGTYLSAYTSLDLDLREGIGKRESVEMFDFVRSHTREDDVIVFVKPRVMALLTGRDSSTYHQPDDDDQLWDYFDQIRATHVVAVNNDATMTNYESGPRLAWLRGFVARNESRLTRVFQNGDFSVYEIAANRET